MNKYFLIPALATGAGILLSVGSASAGGEMPVVNCVGTQPDPVICMVLKPGVPDSDGDGFPDTDEMAFGSDPFDPSSRPTMKWVIIRLGDGTLPSFEFEPALDLITVTPDGHAITTDIAGALGDLGHDIPDRLAGAGLTMPGVDLGSIGGLDWDIHNNGASSNPAPSDMPNTDLISSVPGCVTNVFNTTKQGDIYVSTVIVSRKEGGVTEGVGTGTGMTPETAESAAKTIAEANAAARIAAAEAAKQEKEAKAARTAADEAAKKAKEAQEAEDKKNNGEHYDPDADQGVDPSTLTFEQLADMVAKNDGSDHTNTGNTGVDFTETELVDPIIEIINVNPDADANGGTDTPNIGGDATPEGRPDLPDAPGDFNGVPSQGGGGN